MGRRGKYLGVDAHGLGDIHQVRFADVPDLFIIANVVGMISEVIGQAKPARSSSIEDQCQNTSSLAARNRHEFQDPKALHQSAMDEGLLNKVDGVTTKALFENNKALFKGAKDK